ncbi:hypothetical protein PsorP6_014460 [Peronosclerospora sorghi]|uniref:Uncharacterized protein n=1 Tax=Peronosclerospora sorghi TaxID=230839 RepID=A0ACC0VTL0_9STRA|nr:hypothetical protein PsorP6_014460 [Peronosclerospora sorghi]
MRLKSGDRHTVALEGQQGNYDEGTDVDILLGDVEGNKTFATANYLKSEKSDAAKYGYTQFEKNELWWLHDPTHSAMFKVQRPLLAVKFDKQNCQTYRTIPTLNPVGTVSSINFKQSFNRVRMTRDAIGHITPRTPGENHKNAVL